MANRPCHDEVRGGLAYPTTRYGNQIPVLRVEMSGTLC
jgi:hypothetical protein